MFKITTLLVLSTLSLGSFADNPARTTVSRIVDAVGNRFVPDKRTALFDLIIGEYAEQLIIRGKTNLPQAKQALLDSLSQLQISFTDSILVLPEKALGEKIWALAALSVSNIRSGPDHTSELVSQALMGTPLKVLEKVDGWYRVQTPDKYIGWVDESGMALRTEAQMGLWKNGKRCIYNELAGIALEAPKRKSPPVSDLVLGDLFETRGQTKKYLHIQFPDGRMAFVKKSDCLSYKKWADQNADKEAVVQLAIQLLGSPYLWGGTSSKAVDCSGMVKIAWFSQGLILARDASQQARYGESIDFSELKNLQRGDLLFFGRSPERITHVGIYLGNGQYIHASGLVRINSIDPQDPLYNITDRKQLVGASRVKPSAKEIGRLRVKDHDWY